MTDEDTTVKYQTGKVSGVFKVGAKIEAVFESYSGEIKTFEAMKAGMSLVAKGLLDYQVHIVNEQRESRLPLKEAEVAKLYVARCVDLVQKLILDTEAKRLQAIGASEAMQRMVDSVKRVYDEENDKLKQFVDYSSSEKDLLKRPVGYPPETSSGQKWKPKKSKKAI